MDIPIQIANSTSPIIVRTDDLWNPLSIATIILAIGTCLLVIITYLGNKKTNEHTRESNEQVKRSNYLLTIELREKYRPDFSFTKSQIQYESEQTNNAIFSGLITNKGQVTLNNIVYYYFKDTKQITLYELLKNEHEIIATERKINGTFEPQRYHQFQIQFHEDNKNEIWFALWLNYEYLDELKEEYVAIIGFKNLQSSFYETYNHDLIQKARQDFIKNKGAPSSGI